MEEEKADMGAGNEPLFDFFAKLSNKDKIHFANCMFDDLFLFGEEVIEDEEYSDLDDDDES